ncbi:MAG: starch-binding protein, partial [Acutalibacteraceae bacterium]
QHSDFTEAAQKLWNQKFLPALDILNGKTAGSGRLKSLDEYSALVADSAKMNYTLWNLSDTLLVSEAGTTHESQLAYYLKWISQRQSFMNGFFTDLETAKARALAELEAYKNAFNESDYDADIWNSFLKEYQSGINAINAAATNVELNSALTDAQSAMKNALGDIYVYFDNTKTQWDKVYIFWWGSSEVETPSWPGVTMTDCGNGIWKYRLDKSIQNVIFDNGNNGAQTEDLTSPYLPNQIWVPDYENMTLHPSKGELYSGQWTDYYVKGDVNGDRKVNLMDAVIVQKVSLDILTLDGQNKLNADMNGDGKITVYDAIMIQKLALSQ